MDTKHRIKGKVAQILNDRELVITCGHDVGVAKGMTFAVLNRRGAEITDPDSGEVLGSVEIPKALVRAVRVDDRLAVARTYRETVINTGGEAAELGISKLFQPPKLERVPETLRIEGKEHLLELDPSESIVKIGDSVVQVEEGEFLDT